MIGDLTIRLIAYCAYRLGLAGGRAAGMGRFIRYRSAAGRLALVPMLASIRDPARSFPIVVCQFTVFLTADRALGLSLAGGSTAGMRRFVLSCFAAGASIIVGGISLGQGFGPIVVQRFSILLAGDFCFFAHAATVIRRHTRGFAGRLHSGFDYFHLVFAKLSIGLFAYITHSFFLTGGGAAGMCRFVRYRSAARRFALMPMLVSIRDPDRSVPIVGDHIHRPRLGCAAAVTLAGSGFVARF